MQHAVDSTVLHTVRTRIVTDYSQQVRECLQALTDDQLWWRANESANSIGNLVLHLCGSTWYYLLRAVGGHEFERDRPQEFAERTRISRAQLIQKLDDLIAACDSVLQALKPEDLSRTTDRTGKASSYAQILLSVLCHFATHTGQILYATKMQKEGAVNELWMKYRK